MTRITACILIACGSIVAAVDAEATILISNLEASPFPTSAVTGIGRTTLKAMGFVMPAGSDYVLDSVLLGLEVHIAQMSDPYVQIWNNDVNDLPGSPLFTLNGPTQLEQFVFQFTPSSPFTLTAGATYWLVVGALDSGFLWRVGTNVPPTGIATHFGAVFGGRHGSSISSLSFSLLEISQLFNNYEINATPVAAPVPAPASWTLVVLGLAMLALCRRMLALSPRARRSGPCARPGS